MDPAVVAEDDGAKERREVARRPTRLRALHLTVRTIALAGDRVRRAREPDATNGHLVHRQRPGLVGADHGRAPEGLDGGELLHDGPLTGHAVQPEGERDGHHHREALRNGRHREGHGLHRHLRERITAHELEQRDDPDDEAGGDGEPLREEVELQLQGRRRRHRALEHPRDAPHLGSAPRGGDDELRAPAGDDRVHENDVVPLAERCREG